MEEMLAAFKEIKSYVTTMLRPMDYPDMNYTERLYQNNQY